MKIKKIVIFGLFALAMSTAKAVTLVEYDISSASGDPVSLTGVSASGVTSSPLSRSSGVTEDAFWDTSVDLLGAADWPMSASLDTGKYFTFTVTPAAAKMVSFDTLTFALFREENTSELEFQGPRQWEVRSSADGFASTLGSGALVQGGEDDYRVVQTFVSLSDLSSQIPDTTDPVEFRIYLFERSGSESLSYGGLSNGADSASVDVVDFQFENSGTNLVLTGSIVDSNSPPSFTHGESTSLTVDEDAAPTSIDSQLAVDDSDSDQTLTWSLSSAPSNGTVAGLSPSPTASSGGTDIQPSGITYEPNADFSGSDSFEVQVSDGEDVDTITFNVTVDNLAPVFNSSATASFAEDGVGTVLDVNADNGGVGTNDSGVSYSITGGVDAGAFNINASTGELTFQSVPDFENPIDSDANNAYEVQVTADDGQASNNTSVQAITVTVTDINEPPTLSLGAASGSLDENNTPNNVVTAITVDDDGLGTNNLSLSGADAGSFQINGSNLEFTATADFETQSSYSVTVEVDDTAVGSTPDDSQTFTLTINDVNEAPTITLNNTVTTLPDDTDTTARVKVADIVVDDDALGSNTTSLAGADSGVFEIDGTELFLSAGTALDATTDSDLSVSVQVDDTSVGSTPDDMAPLDISVTDATPPAVTITSSVNDPTTSDPFQVTITFTEPVTGFVVGDIDVTNGSASNLSTGDDAVFTADISAAADGSVTVDVPAGVAQDAAGNDNQAATPFSVVFDGTAPVLQSIARLSPTDEVTNADTLTFRATFDTDVQNVDPADFTATGTTAALAVSVVTADSVFDLTVSGGDLADLDATVGIDLAAGQDIVDAAGNALPGSEPATDETYTVDNTAPSVTVDSLITADTTPPLTGTVDDNDATLELTVDGQTMAPTNNGDGTWALADDTLSALADGTYDVAVTASDPAGNEGSDTTTDELTVTPDTDGDGVADTVEDAGPNGGDANNDGTPDADQSDVTSLPTATGRGYMTVSVSGACSQLQQVAAVAPGSLPDDPAGNPYPFGLVEFELPCEAATVQVIYHEASTADFLNSTYRKYGPVTPGDVATADWYDFSDYASLSDNTWTLDLADNQLGDDTGDDSLIVDQGGPARGPALPVPIDQPWALWLLIGLSLLLARRGLPRASSTTR
ncbi:Ig-like domain-containing protein [Wenzhouxiangella sp. EGI_FJ10305]|uniref:Ig-like domain-containing protein n=1 Tax=Wenzhouxiangella sp. EGI_FJ10305 TaxID=3243768 RepID=UPI0035DF59BA